MVHHHSTVTLSNDLPQRHIQALSPKTCTLWLKLLASPDERQEYGLTAQVPDRRKFSDNLHARVQILVVDHAYI